MAPKRHHLEPGLDRNFSSAASHSQRVFHGSLFVVSSHGSRRRNTKAIITKKKAGTHEMSHNHKSCSFRRNFCPPSQITTAPQQRGGIALIR